MNTVHEEQNQFVSSNLVGPMDDCETATEAVEAL